MRLSSALLSALMLTVPLLGCAALYLWYKGAHYRESSALHFLSLGAIMFVGLTCGFLWGDDDQDND
ncbi:MAG TPA: hypothetical protein VHS33_06985 [Sphingomicrobium sp.]|nr:hypothetical protein [Sphingomicrobium sp.]